MDNYAYIIASLPVLHQEDARPEHFVAEELIEEIRGQLSRADAAVLDLLLEGYDSDKLDAGFYRDALAGRGRFVRDWLRDLVNGYDADESAEFYRRALAHGNRFIREWFRFDLDLRNATVAFLNDSLGRPEGQDLVLLAEREAEEFPEEEDAQEVLNRADLLRRERGLDDLRWRKIDELTAMDVFNLESILGFVAKLKIIDRWLQLDPEAGRTLFRKLVEDVRSTYDNKKQDITI